MRAYAVRIERLRSCCNNACDALSLQLLVVSMEEVGVQVRGQKEAWESTFNILSELQWHLLHLQSPTQPQPLARDTSVSSARASAYLWWFNSVILARLLFFLHIITLQFLNQQFHNNKPYRLGSRLP